MSDYFLRIEAWKKKFYSLSFTFCNNVKKGGKKKSHAFSLNGKDEPFIRMCLPQSVCVSTVSFGAGTAGSLERALRSLWGWGGREGAVTMLKH